MIFQIDLLVFFTGNFLPMCDVNFDSMIAFQGFYSLLSFFPNKLQPCFFQRTFSLLIYLQPFLIHFVGTVLIDL